MIYIDFDGVILDTENVLFEDWRKNPNRKSLPESVKIKYIQEKDWNHILNNSPIINDSLYNLKNMDHNNSAILTKIHSLTNEGTEKIKWIRDKGIKQTIILVPYNLRKCDVVDAANNILIDDCLKNLDEWVEKGGIPVFFDMNDDGYDSWNMPNTKGYQKVLSLAKYKKY